MTGRRFLEAQDIQARHTVLFQEITVGQKWGARETGLRIQQHFQPHVQSLFSNGLFSKVRNWLTDTCWR